MKTPFKFTLPSENSPNGNAFVILGMWQTAAKRAGWNTEEIKETMDKAMAGDYEKLRSVLKSAAAAGKKKVGK